MAYVRVGALSATFRATITVMANAGASITAVGPKTYSTIANGDGVAVLLVKKKGSYVVSSSAGALFTETVNVTEHRNYSIDLYKANTQTITISATQSWLVPRGVRQLEVCCIGAGGGGGGIGYLRDPEHPEGTAYYFGSGGGGGGGYKTVSTINVVAGTSYLATIGTGGSPSSTESAGTRGGTTSFGSISAEGGYGGGYSYLGGAGGNGGNNGGSGAYGYNISSGGGGHYTGTNGSGNAIMHRSVYYAGGGGGAGGYGKDWPDNRYGYSNGGEGGNRGGGKGAGGYVSGQSSGGYNIYTTYNAVAGTPNTGGGGGGTEYNHTSSGASGGSGVIIVTLNP